MDREPAAGLVSKATGGLRSLTLALILSAMTASSVTLAAPANAVVNGPTAANLNTGMQFIGHFHAHTGNPVTGERSENCGATLISASYAVTAAHCVLAAFTGWAVKASDITLTFGRTKLADTTSGWTSGVSQIIIEPGSDPGHNVKDLVILKLSSPLPGVITPKLGGACPDWSLGSPVLAIGSGQSGDYTTGDTHKDSEKYLYQASLTVSALQAAPPDYIGAREVDSSKEGHLEFGDSGDGLIYRSPNGGYELLGVFHNWFSTVPGFERVDGGSGNAAFMSAYGVTASNCPTPPANKPPVASFIYSRVNGAASQFAFDGTGSKDSDGQINSYAWSVNGKQLATGPKPTFSLPFNTSTSVTLTVTDNAGATGQSTQIVGAPDRAPTLDSVSPSGSIVSTTTPTLAASASDPDAESLQYHFSVSGPSVSLDSGWVGSTWPVPAHSLDPGTKYSFTVTVKDPEGLTASKTGAFTVAMLPTAADLIPTSTGKGYWQVASDGGVFSYGDARFYGSVPGLSVHTNTIMGMARTPDDGGYWEVGTDGGVFAFGNASFYNSLPGLGIHVNNIVGMAPTKSGKGYWLVGSDGGVFAFGDAGYYGSMGGKVLNAPVVSLSATPSGNGYWLAAADGGVFAFGDAPFYGSMGGQHLDAPVTDLDVTPDGQGYWLAAEDGGIFAYGDAPYYGSMAGKSLNGHITGMAATADGKGYWLNGCDGGVFAFGDAPFYGSNPTYQCRGV